MLKEIGALKPPRGQPGRVVRSFNELPFFSKAPAPPLIGALLDPHNPEYNRTTLQRFLSAWQPALPLEMALIESLTQPQPAAVEPAALQR